MTKREELLNFIENLTEEEAEKIHAHLEYVKAAAIKEVSPSEARTDSVSEA